jgi:hypothetical protein
MSSSIGQQYHETMRQQQLPISDHPEPIVAKSVKNDDRVAVRALRHNRPPLQRHTVRGGNRDVCHHCLPRLNRLAETSDLVLVRAPSHGMHRSVGKKNPSDDTKAQI